MVEKIISGMVSNDIIQSGDKELYAYGLKQGIIMLLNIATTVAIGALLGMLWQSILFMAMYIQLRSFAGGYHARTQARCYMLSIPLVTASLLAIQHISAMEYIVLCLGLLGSIVIWIFAPVADKNKPLEDKEAMVFRKSARIILCVETCVLLIFVAVGFAVAAACVSVSLAVLACMVGIGRLKLKG